jgi:P27 family predicted phage terminase small subunit
MKPQGYLTENGKAIFDFIIESHLKSNGIMEVDTYNLTALANAFDLHERASYIMNNTEGGFCQTTKNNYSQVRAEFTVWQKTLDMIHKLSPSFGITPSSREKIKAFAEEKKENEPDALSKI